MDQATQWPYILPHFHLPHNLFTGEMGICQDAQDTKMKSNTWLDKAGYWAFGLHNLGNLPMPLQIMDL